MEELLAKKWPKETLKVHIENVLKVWASVSKEYSNKIVSPEFWELSFISVLFHDLGKVCLNFQDVMHNRVHHFDNYIRHELYSGVFLLLNNKERFIANPLPVLSIFSHHRPLNENIFDNENETVEAKVANDTLNDLIRFYQQQIDLNNFEFSFNEAVISKFNNSLRLSTLVGVFKNYIKNISTKFSLRTRKEYICYKAILTICDWLGSAHEMPDRGITFTKGNLKGKIITKLKNEDKTNIAAKFEFRKFQVNSIIFSNVIAIAPTGSGKTEAALLWASQKQTAERIVYLLPTRVTSNSIYNRLKQYFPDIEISLVHSSALFYQKETDENYDKKKYIKNKTFFHNINVCTIDQVLTQGFNLGYWELKTFHMMDSWVIIDEIHLYSPYTLALIISTIFYLKNEFRARFYIMSATMPEKLKKLLAKTLGESNYKLIQDLELLDIARNIFIAKDCPIDEIFEDIKSDIRSGKKVLVVLNTVNEAIRVYNEVKSSACKAFCYHSRFMQKDRLTKENEILDTEKTESSLLLVATQVVEVSLDIDFDILYTENAPIDAIIQRAGRINRKREKINTKVIVFRESEITRKWVYDIPEILDNTFSLLQTSHKKMLTEKDLIEMVDRVYHDIDIEVNEHYIEGSKKYNEIQRGLHFVKDNVNKDEIYTREGLDTISVIPMINTANEYGEEEIYYYSDFIKKDAFEKAKHELSVRKQKKHSHILETDGKGFYYIDAYYDYEIGLVFNNEYLEEKTIIC